MAVELHLDVETYSSVDIRTSGAYKYCESIDFEILLVAYAFGKGEIKIIDLSQGEKLPSDFIKALFDPQVKKWAHNANFERNAFRAIGYDVPIKQWFCSAVKAGYCGLPLPLALVSEALNLQEKGKLSTGRALIKFFTMLCKPSKTNGGRSRNFPEHDPEKWEEFKIYCINDVEAEREVCNILAPYDIPETERLNYILDQEINDRGILVDLKMAQNAVDIDKKHSKVLFDKMVKISGLENPNSLAQLKAWLSNAINKDITTLAKDSIPELIEEAGPGPVSDILKLRLKSSKTSIKKYIAMLNCACDDERAHGLFQFYGSRTGRWAGRLIQLQNLPQNHLADLVAARRAFASGSYDLCALLYEDPASTLSQLIRTTFIAKEGHTFAVADFSAIEARVIAWLANEVWRLEVFEGDGKIYEASAEMMFDLPAGSVKKGSPERDKGKVAELALGYQGGVGALKQMGGEAMGLNETEMQEIVDKWRAKSPRIKKLWYDVQGAAIKAIRYKKEVILKDYKNLIFDSDGEVMTIKLPSGRKLFYQSPTLTVNKWGGDSVKYKGMDSVTRKWAWTPSYGGKFVENIVQAIARDLLADSMRVANGHGYKIVMHVHDEMVVEIPEDDAADDLRTLENIMGAPNPWAGGLPLNADGYLTPFYKKD